MAFAKNTRVHCPRPNSQIWGQTAVHFQHQLSDKLQTKRCSSGKTLQSQVHPEIPNRSTFLSPEVFKFRLFGRLRRGFDAGRCSHVAA